MLAPPLLAETPSLNEARWTAVAARASGADGAFFYSVRTTGVYCRPSCGARLPRRENVAFHATPAEAEAAGFRPCKRCRPTEAPAGERQAEAIARACRLIEAAETPPSLNALAESAGLSPHHFHRVFKSVTGITPKAYADAERSRRVRDGLAKTDTVTEAIYDAGFNSGGRFYEQSDGVLGMTPTRFRKGGERTTIHFGIAETSLGALLAAATDKGVCAILIGDDPDALARDLQRRFPRAQLIGGDPGFEALLAKAVGLVERPGLGVDLPLDIRGTVFQQRVWQALREIRAGETVSYAELARRIDAPSAVRAVARACAANNIAVAVPCHRVVRNDGGLSGYAWGVERKRALLDREGGA